jgi:hypothetical protein
MYELIISNQNRYVFIPLTFSIKDNKTGHATMLIIDKQKFIFFNSIFYELTHFLKYYNIINIINSINIII